VAMPEAQRASPLLFQGGAEALEESFAPASAKGRRWGLAALGAILVGGAVALVLNSREPEPPPAPPVELAPSASAPSAAPSPAPVVSEAPPPEEPTSEPSVTAPPQRSQSRPATRPVNVTKSTKAKKKTKKLL